MSKPSGRPNREEIKGLRRAQMDVNQIEQAHVDLIQALIRKKKFCRYLVGNCYSTGPQMWIKRSYASPQKTRLGTLLTRACMG